MPIPNQEVKSTKLLMIRGGRLTASNFWVAVLVVGLNFSCAVKHATVDPQVGPFGTTEVALQHWPELDDHGQLVHLQLAIERQLAWFDSQNKDLVWRFGQEAYSREDMRGSLRLFQQALNKHGLSEQLVEEIQRDFRLFKMTVDPTSKVLVTGYHSPVYEGSLKPSGEYRFPLYRLPNDLIRIDADAFAPEILKKGDRLVRGIVYGRYDAEHKSVLPYYTRRQIDLEHALAGRELEIVYLSSYIDVFLFHVQGGGFVKLAEGGYLKVNYAGKNGWPYRSIGRVLVDEGLVPEKDISIPAIKAHFARVPDDEMRVCLINQSYVFYEWDGTIHETVDLSHYPHGVLGFPVTPKRSIATDKRLFPGGALAWISSKQRHLDGSATPFSGFVIDQDTGGAIEDAHVDFFLGAGVEAERDAGLLMDDNGQVYFLVAKKAAVDRLVKP